MRDEIARLKQSYGLFCIGHTKLRDVTEKGSTEAYQQLTTSLSFDFDSVFADKADIIATISVDKDIIDVQEVKQGKDSTKLVGTIGGVTRWIHFRDDNFNVDCGVRFGEIDDKVELSAENYINAIEQAIKSASGKSEKEIKSKRDIETKERVEKAKEIAESSKSVDVDRNNKLLEIIKAKFPKATAEVKAQVKKLLSDNNISLSDVDTAKTSIFEEIVTLLVPNEDIDTLLTPNEE